MASEFSSLGLSPSLLAVLAELGHETPTPIQAKSIPTLLAGKDLIGQSKTGSGKTAAFGLPILEKLALERKELQALVVCPTRELSAQVAREIRKLGRRHPGLQVLALAGGEPIRPQTKALQRGVHVAVGTPGRLLDHLNRRSLDTRSVATVVLDEADRMLDMGFQADMETILSELPASRQTVFFSATFPPSIETMSRAHQRKAVRVTIAERERAAPDDLGRIAVQALLEAREPEAQRQPRADGARVRALDEHPHDSALIFCNFKATVASLERALSAKGASVGCLHGDLEQFDRDQILARFRNQSVRILIATDVAGRGIDVEGLDLVINYEMSGQAEIYVHRIGRTGRAGKGGLAVSLLTERELWKLEAIESLTGAPIERVPSIFGGGTDFAALAKRVGQPSTMETILISGGRKDKVRPGDILGALTGEAGGLDAKDIGKIEIHDRLSYVAVSRRVSRAAVKGLNQGRIKARRFRASLV